MRAAQMLECEAGSFSELLKARALEHGGKTALIDGERSLTYAELDALMDRGASALQRAGVRPGDIVALCTSRMSLEAVAGYLAVVRAGAAAAPIPASLAPHSLALLLADTAARIVFLDGPVWEGLSRVADGLDARRVALDGSEAGAPFWEWLAPPGSVPTPVAHDPSRPFNIIYSSGTTGVPKGIVHTHAMRWSQVRTLSVAEDTVALVSLTLYSNMALLSLLPTLAHGGAVVLMPKFDAGEFLRLAEAHRVTNAMMVPVQVHRILEHPDFDRRDLSSFRMKNVAGSPFSPRLKQEVLRRWPGGLSESYGMTEGGGACMLAAHLHPDKLHTVGPPVPGNDIRIIDDEGRELPQGELGEVVGRGPTVMAGYHNQPERSKEAFWTSPEGLAFVRTGDIGRFDEDGFLQLLDRKKDMIISGGFNIYPSDLEAELGRHPAVSESAVVGVSSERWGETPVAFVVRKSGSAVEAAEIREWLNARVGKTQRVSDLRLVEALPRNHNGKVLKRELREAYEIEASAA